MLLCQACNKGLGWFKDSIPILKGAIDYLTMQAFDVEVTQTKKTVYRAVSANTAEEATTIAEGMAEDGYEGEVLEIMETMMDAYPSEELPEVE